MKRLLLSLASLLFLPPDSSSGAEPDFPLTEDSKPHDGVPKGELIRDKYVTKGIFPGTEREYAIYLPANLDKTQPAPFMVFQDGVIYNAPTVFDNLIAKKEIPPLVGIFIKPGIGPAANGNSLPRYNRSYEYDSVTDTYARFLIEEFLPAIEKKHHLWLSHDADARGIAGNSSGGICAFMVAWHRPDEFRRVFTGVGTYVGIHGADQLPVLVRKHEPKPLRVFLQSGENDNNLYCGDWWMANQMMERALTWNGYDVNHAWGTGGHNAKHATQIFPEALRWLWKGFPNEPVKANPRGDSKWRGYEVIGDGEWKEVARLFEFQKKLTNVRTDMVADWHKIVASKDGSVFLTEQVNGFITRIAPDGSADFFGPRIPGPTSIAALPDGNLLVSASKLLSALKPGEDKEHRRKLVTLDPTGKVLSEISGETFLTSLIVANSGERYVIGEGTNHVASVVGGIFGGMFVMPMNEQGKVRSRTMNDSRGRGPHDIALTPDQTQIYASLPYEREVQLWKVGDAKQGIGDWQPFVKWEASLSPDPYAHHNDGGICVDTNGWLYIATDSGVQVCDQCGRVNFIIRTPEKPLAVCFGGKDLSDLFITCGDTVYRRSTKARGCISGQMAPIKPPPPKL